MIDDAIVLVYRAITTVKIVDDAVTSAKIKLVPLSLLSKIAHIVLFPNLLQKYNVACIGLSTSGFDCRRVCVDCALRGSFNRFGSTCGRRHTPGEGFFDTIHLFRVL